jgi:hypothetical protein
MTVPAEATSVAAGSVWQNRKTSGLYRVVNVAMEATNAREGARVVIYRPGSVTGVDDGPALFVRDETEFLAKFTPFDATTNVPNMSPPHESERGTWRGELRGVKESARFEYRCGIAACDELYEHAVRVGLDTRVAADFAHRINGSLSLLEGLVDTAGRSVGRFLTEQLTDARAETQALQDLINTPETADFLRGVEIEMPHQRARWGSEHDAGKTPADWFWLIGYLVGKALHAQNAGDLTKAQHHTISSAAAMGNWHRSMTGAQDMRPGLSAEATAGVDEEPDAAPGTAG